MAKEKKHLSFLLVFLIIVGVAFLSIIIVKATPRSTKIYRNNTYGIEFMYDSSSKLVYEIKNGHAFIDGIDRGPFQTSSSTVIATVDDDTLTAERDGHKYMDDVNYFILELVPSCGESGSTDMINKSGTPYKYTERAGVIQGKGYGRYACVSMNGQNWSLSNESLYDENQEKTEKLFNIILNSFKFTEK